MNIYVHIYPKGNITMEPMEPMEPSWKKKEKEIRRELQHGSSRATVDAKWNEFMNAVRYEKGEMRYEVISPCFPTGAMA